MRRDVQKKKKINHALLSQWKICKFPANPANNPSMTLLIQVLDLNRQPYSFTRGTCHELCLPALIFRLSSHNLFSCFHAHRSEWETYLLPVVSSVPFPCLRLSLLSLCVVVKALCDDCGRICVELILSHLFVQMLYFSPVRLFADLVSKRY